MDSSTPRLLLVCALCAAIAPLLSGPAAAGWPPPEAPALRLHRDLPVELDRAWLDRLGLFPALDGLQRARFERAPWGGLLVRFEVADADQGTRVLVRNLTRAHWDGLRVRAAAILAGDEAPPPPPLSPLDELPAYWPATGDPGPDSALAAEAPDDPLAGIRAWPELPPPPAALPRDLLLEAGPVPWQGRWLALVDVGARVNVTSFNTFFTPMGQVGIAFGRGLGARLMPLVGFYAGFGDMRSGFEDAFGEGRTNVFGFTLAALVRQEVSEYHALYVEGGGGYHIRSLYWGGIFYDPRSGQYVRGRVIEQQTWGWHVRAGWLRSRDHATRPRLWDIGLGLQSATAERWAFRSEDDLFVADGRDVWVVLSVRFWDGL